MSKEDRAILNHHIVQLDTTNENTILSSLICNGIFDSSCIYLYEKYKHYILDKLDTECINNFINGIQEISKINNLEEECEFFFVTLLKLLINLKGDMVFMEQERVKVTGDINDIFSELENKINDFKKYKDNSTIQIKSWIKKHYSRFGGVFYKNQYLTRDYAWQCFFYYVADEFFLFEVCDIIMGEFKFFTRKNYFL